VKTLAEIRAESEPVVINTTWEHRKTLVEVLVVEITHGRQGELIHYRDSEGRVRKLPTATFKMRWKKKL
jgi:hypothetical protein